VGDHRTYALQTIQWTYAGPHGHTLFFGIPGRRAPFRPLCNSIRHTLRLSDVHCFIRELVANFFYKYTSSPLIPHAHFHLLCAPRLLEPILCLLSEKLSVCFKKGVSKEGISCSCLASG
jgi:hypothetical protein